MGAWRGTIKNMHTKYIITFFVVGYLPTILDIYLLEGGMNKPAITRVNMATGIPLCVEVIAVKKRSMPNIQPMIVPMELSSDFIEK